MRLQDENFKEFTATFNAFIASYDCREYWRKYYHHETLGNLFFKRRQNALPRIFWNSSEPAGGMPLKEFIKWFVQADNADGPAEFLAPQNLRARPRPPWKSLTAWGLLEAPNRV